MSLQWTLVAIFLYAEIAVTVLLMLPFVSATVWQKLFKSRFMKKLGAYSNFYFMAFMVILMLLFLDSVRQMQKYSHDLEDHNHLDTELQRNMKIFRAQRNCYISGFALFLAPVIYRLGSLLSKEATLTASAAASIKQAKSASDMAEKLMQEKEKWVSMEDELNENKGNDRLENERIIASLKERLQEASEELRKTNLDLTAVKAQAEGTNMEYDRLLSEHDKLQEELGKSKDSVKKDD